jgi:tetratricopeptide (TPR) repeat protein
MAAGRPPRAPSSGKDAALLQEIEGKHQQAQQLFALKKYGEAVTVWRDALMKAREIQNVQTKRAVQPVIAGSLGCALDLNGEYKEAIEWHGKAFKTHGSLGDTLAQCGDICNAGNAYLNAASAGDVQAVSSAEECFGLGHVIALEHDHRDAAATAQAGLANCQKMRSNLGMVQTESVKAPTLSSVAEEEKPADKPCPWNVKKTLSTAGSNALK